jgi:uncharacterized protein YjiS (DUF1127 family)
MSVQSLKMWTRLGRDASLLRDMDDRELQGIGINRVDIAAVRPGTHKRTSSEDAEWIVF